MSFCNAWLASSPAPTFSITSIFCCNVLMVIPPCCSLYPGQWGRYHLGGLVMVILYKPAKTAPALRRPISYLPGINAGVLINPSSFFQSIPLSTPVTTSCIDDQYGLYRSEIQGEEWTMVGLSALRKWCVSNTYEEN